MKRSLLLLLILLVLIFTSCRQVVQLRENRSLKLLNVEAQEVDNYQVNRNATILNQEETEEKVKETVKNYLELAYLDLDINAKKGELLNFFDESVKDKALNQFNKITLGQQAKKLSSVNKAEVTLPVLTVIWDKANKPVMALVEFLATDIGYKTNSQAIIGEATGSLVMTKVDSDYKIVDYRVKQKIEPEKEGK